MLNDGEGFKVSTPSCGDLGGDVGFVAEGMGGRVW